MKKNLFILSFVLTGVIISFAQSPVSINTSDFSYSQNFNTLTTAGNWTNGSTLTGWYARSDAGIPSSFYLNDGTLTTTSPPLASFGTVSDSDRALGFVPVGSNNKLQSICLRMKNNSGATLTTFTISWDGEQWRNGSIESQYIKLYYKTSTDPITVVPITTTGLTPVNQFDSPENLSSGQPPVELDGNDAANRGTLSATISVSLANQSEIIFVWLDTRNEFSFDHLFAIDNVSVTSSTQQSQTITFPEFEDIEYDNVSFSAGATASSGLPVTYTSSNTNVVSVSGSNLVIHGAGSAVITASQPGGSGYLPAVSVQRTLNVVPPVPVLSAPSDVTANSFRATWVTDNGVTDASVSYILYVDDNASFSSPLTYASTGKTYNVTGLSPGVIYNFKVVARVGTLYSMGFSNSQSVLIGNDIVITTPGNWSQVIGNNTVADKITIAAPIVVDTDPEIDELVINSNGSLTVSSGRTLKINNRLIIISDVNNNSGKILNRGTVNINSAAQIVIRKAFETGKWNFVGFPFSVSNVYQANTTTPASWGLDNYATANIYVKRYNGAVRASSGHVAAVWEYFTPAVLTANRGYILWSYSNASYDFVISAANKGAFLNSSASYGLTEFLSANPVNANWNLVVSPFSSTFNLKELGQGPFYLYNENTGGYNVIMPGANADLRPYTSFFLQRQSATLAFVDLGRKLMPAEFDNSGPEFDEVNMVIKYRDYEDVMRLRLKEGATDAYVIGSDAVKMLADFPQVPQLYSVSKNVSYAVNTLPYNTKEVELYVRIGEPGDYSIALSDLALLNNCKVILVDKVTGESVDMLLQNEYKFTSYVKGTFNRFKVILSNENSDVSTGGALYVDKSGLRIFRHNGSIAFDGLNSPAQITEYDTSGRKLSSSYNIDNKDYILLKSKSVSVLEIITHDQNIRIKVTNK